MRPQERRLLELAGAAAAGAVLALALTRGRPRRRRDDDDEGPPESLIRRFTRLAIEHDAVNLGQGFPNEPPPRAMSAAAAGALLSGADAETATLAAAALELEGPASATKGLDQLNQYSYPFGMPSLRQALQRHVATYHPEMPCDADANITVVLGATEGMAVCLRALCAPGDVVTFFEPYHELYPAQCTLWGLVPNAVTLVEDAYSGTWTFDEGALEKAVRKSRVLVLNTPHNPTGKVFTRAELSLIGKLCEKYDTYVITDEIYEHLVYKPAVHLSLASVSPAMAARTCVVSAVSKTAKATGWRVGWVVSPANWTQKIRAVHDLLVVQAPTPLQFGVQRLLETGSGFFDAQAAEYVSKRDLLTGALRAAGFTIAVEPAGAYYLFARFDGVPALSGMSSYQAAVTMVEKHKIACIPGSNFYLNGEPEKYLRFAFVRSVDVLAAGVAALQRMSAGTAQSARHRLSI